MNRDPACCVPWDWSLCGRVEAHKFTIFLRSRASIFLVTKFHDICVQLQGTFIVWLFHKSTLSIWEDCFIRHVWTEVEKNLNHSPTWRARRRGRWRRSRRHRWCWWARRWEGSSWCLAAGSSLQPESREKTYQSQWAIATFKKKENVFTDKIKDLRNLSKLLLQWKSPRKPI